MTPSATGLDSVVFPELDAPLLRGIPDVFLLGTFPEMRGVHTIRDIASMENILLRPCPMMQEPRDAMGVGLPSVWEMAKAMSELSLASNPKPTGRGLVDLVPKPLLEGPSVPASHRSTHAPPLRRMSERPGPDKLPRELVGLRLVDIHGEVDVAVAREVLGPCGIGV